MCESRLKVQLYHFSGRAPFKNAIYFSKQIFPSGRLFCMCPLEESLHLPPILEKKVAFAGARMRKGKYLVLL